MSEAARHRQAVAALDLDLVDPIGRSPAVHREVADRIDRDVTSVIARLSPLLPLPLDATSRPSVRELA
jgi:hypothetical protein